ncbi:MAG: hypothetical protein ABSG54_07645 [Terriglobia bacterium]|jgi:hypothetical protein
MTAKHSLQNLPPTQVLEPKPEQIHSLGATHPTGDLLEYLAGASPTGLANFELKNCGQLNEIRRELRTVLERWLDGLALEKFIAWQQRKPRPVNGGHVRAESVREPIPDDLDGSFEPFLRPRGQAAAIRREQTMSQRRIWGEHFRHFGCLAKGCESGESYGGSGVCLRCHTKIKARLAAIGQELRLAAARVS